MANDNDEKQSIAPASGLAPSVDAGLHSHGGTRVIQPLAGGVIDDPPPPTPPGRPTPPVPQSPETPLIPEATVGDSPANSSNSIYPTATSGIGSNNTDQQNASPLAASSNIMQPPTENDILLTDQPEKHEKLLVFGTWIIGAFIVGGASLSLVQIIFAAGSGLGVVSTIFDIFYILIGIGIIARREMARKIYVFLALLGIIFSVIGTISYLNYLHTVSSSEARYITKSQQSINKIENDKSLSVSERQQEVQVIQQNVALDKKNNKNNEERLLSLILAYLIALVPLVYLTRPSVKKLFD